MGAPLSPAGTRRAQRPLFKAASLAPPNHIHLIGKGFCTSPVALERLENCPRTPAQPLDHQPHFAPRRDESPALARPAAAGRALRTQAPRRLDPLQIGRASWRERVWTSV